MSISSDLERAETVSIMFDEVEGLWFLPEYRLVRDVFADPALIAGRRREAVSGYLKCQSIPPCPRTNHGSASERASPGQHPRIDQLPGIR